MYQDGLISVTEYNYQSFLGSLLKPPPLPVPDQNTHYLLIKVMGGQPTFMGVMTDEKHTYQPTSKDNGHLVFIAVDMKQRKLKVSNSTEGFLLQDGNEIYANIEVKYRIDEVEKFWGIADEPLDVFTSQIVNAAADFFLNINSIDLIKNSYDVKQELEYAIQSNDLKLTKNSLERDIKNINLEGIKIGDVHAAIRLSQELKDYVRRQHGKLFSEDGKMDKARTRELDLTERQHIDDLINKDTTFGQWGLRQIIAELNFELLDNFYTEDWNTAMRRVFQAVEAKKQELLKSQQDARIERLTMRMQQAKELGLGADDMEAIRLKLTDQFLVQIDKDDDDTEVLPSNEELFKKIIGPPNNSNNRLSGNSHQQIGQTDVDN